MDQRAQYLIQVFEKIGAPLVAAVTLGSPDEAAQGHAQKVAELLTKTVKLGIDMAGMAELGGAGDSVRVALSAVAGEMLAEAYRNGQKIPAETELAKITSALQAVLTFSENFTPDAENAERLKELEARGAGLDAHQMNIQYMQAFIPVVNAVGGFSFGQPEQKLVMDIAIRITAAASNMRKALIGELPDPDKKYADLAFLRAVAALYASCHEAETKRLAGGATPEGVPLDKVWKDFETRLALLEALTRGVVMGGGVAAPAPQAEVPPASAVPKTETPPPSPLSSPPSTPPAAESKAPAAPPVGGANPMAMFAKPKAEVAAPEAPASPASPPPPVEAPEVVAPPPVEPPAAPPVTPPATETQSENKGGQTGNPMSFFKKKEGEE